MMVSNSIPTEPLRYDGGRDAVMPGGAAIRPEPEPLRLHAAGRSDGAGAAPRTVTRQRVLFRS
jgi:hypothetical protein